MKISVKFILIFVLLMLSFSKRGNALNDTEELSSVCICQVSSSSSAIGNSVTLDSDVSYSDKLQALSVFALELGVKSISETYSFSSGQRSRLVIEVSGFMKDIIRKLSLRENLLVLDRSKFYHSDKEPYYAQSSCEYYIFALRRILL